MSETLIPVLNSKTGIHRYLVSSGGSVSSLPGYNKFTSANFAIVSATLNVSCWGHGGGAGDKTVYSSGSGSISISYNATTGVVTASASASAPEETAAEAAYRDVKTGGGASLSGITLACYY